MGERLGESLPFISGLPSASAEPTPIDARGLAVLTAIRERAEADIRGLAPLTLRRFDGVERFEPDPDDIQAHAIARSLKRLIDLITSDRALCRQLAARLAQRGGG